MKEYQKRLVESYIELKKEELELYNAILKKELGLDKKPWTAGLRVVKSQYKALHDYTHALYVRLECEGIDTSKIKID